MPEGKNKILKSDLTYYYTSNLNDACRIVVLLKYQVWLVGRWVQKHVRHSLCSFNSSFCHWNGYSIEARPLSHLLYLELHFGSKPPSSCGFFHYHCRCWSKGERCLFTEVRLMVASVNSAPVNKSSIQAKGNIPTHPQCSTSLLMLQHLKQTHLFLALSIASLGGKAI